MARRAAFVVALAFSLLGPMMTSSFAAPAPPAEPSPPPAAAKTVEPSPQSYSLQYEFEARPYRVRVDRTVQQLRIESPKPEAWIGDWIDPNSSVEVTAATPLRVESRTVTTLARGSKLYVTEVKGDWVGTTVLLNGKQQSGWVQKTHVKPLASEPRAWKNIRNAGGDFVSAAMLMQKAKQFDDGLYAAVELAAQNGAGNLASKAQLLQKWASAADPAVAGSGLDVLLAGSQLGGSESPIPASRRQAVDAAVGQFLSSPARSKPLGFYTWSAELSKIFQQDRMLQTPLKSEAEVAAIAKVLKEDEKLRAAYTAHLNLASRMTNPLLGGKSSDLRPLLGNQPPPSGIDEWRILPPSISHETQLFRRLFGDQLTVPDDFDLMQTLIAEIRADKIDLRPRPESGWYDHQTWSLQPLLLPQKMREASHLQTGEEYRKLLENLFKGTLALTRETHVKQLDLPAPAAAAPGGDEPERKIPLVVQPNLTVEPLPSMYLRRAQSYAFVRQVLADSLGSEALKQLHRQTSDGPEKTTLDDELRQMESLFFGAHVVASRQLGLAEEMAAAGEAADKDAVAFLRWSQNVAADVDLGRDCRMMVPVFTDPLKGRIKVWCVLGWASENAYASYARHPALSGTDADGGPVDLASKFDVSFYGQSLALTRPVFAEVWVTELLDRDEFRRHCDTYVLPSVILANLK